MDPTSIRKPQYPGDTVNPSPATPAKVEKLKVDKTRVMGTIAINPAWYDMVRIRSIPWGKKGTRNLKEGDRQLHNEPQLLYAGRVPSPVAG
jgi:hypothetical protein